MKKPLLITVVSLSIGLIMLLADCAPTVKDVKITKTGDKRAAVVFSHSKHAAMTGDKSKDCEGCHNAVKSKKNAHKYCIDCHESMNSDLAAVKCNDCHKPANKS
jgi:hypothetical protein